MKKRIRINETKESKLTLYPTIKVFIGVLLISLTEFPYLLNIHSTNALLYARVFSILIIPLCCMMMIEIFYFNKVHTIRNAIILIVVFAAFIIPLAYCTFTDEFILSPEDSTKIIYLAFCFCFIELIIFSKSISKYIKQIRRKRKSLNITEKYILGDEQILNIIVAVAVITLILSVFDSREMKMTRDVLLLSTNLYISIRKSFFVNQFIGHTQRNVIIEKEETNLQNLETTPNKDKNAPLEEVKNSNNSQFWRRTNGLIDRITDVVIDQRLFMNTEFRLEDLARKVGSNKKYVSQAINESDFKSFSFMINSFRLINAVNEKKLYPNKIQEQIALSSGFSSRFAMIRWMKQYSTSIFPFNDENICNRICNNNSDNTQ